MNRIWFVAHRYVLDIRNNGGGLFPAGVELARMLLDSGDIVLIADSQGVIDSYEATGTAIDAQAPVAVLVNKGTASASEVLLHLHKEFFAWVHRVLLDWLVASETKQ